MTHFIPEIGQNVRIIVRECHPDFLDVVTQINLIMDGQRPLGENRDLEAEKFQDMLTRLSL